MICLFVCQHSSVIHIFLQICKIQISLIAYDLILLNKRKKSVSNFQRWFPGAQHYDKNRDQKNINKKTFSLNMKNWTKKNRTGRLDCSILRAARKYVQLSGNCIHVPWKFCKIMKFHFLLINHFENGTEKRSFRECTVNRSNFRCTHLCIRARLIKDWLPIRYPLKFHNNARRKNVWENLHTFFYRQLHFRSQPGSCLAILGNGLKTELTLPAKTCLNDSSQSELSFGTKISMRNQIF